MVQSNSRDRAQHYLVRLAFARKQAVPAMRGHIPNAYLEPCTDKYQKIRIYTLKRMDILAEKCRRRVCRIIQATDTFEDIPLRHQTGRKNMKSTTAQNTL